MDKLVRGAVILGAAFIVAEAAGIDVPVGTIVDWIIRLVLGFV